MKAENNHPLFPAGSRLLWLTDTFDDHNGVSMVLQSMHEEITKRDLPIDILVCSDKLKSSGHLIVVKAVTEVNLPLYRQQPIRIPNYLEVRRVFISGGYDRIICSTEGPMSMAALYLKKMFSVRTFFYLHTDWIMFARTVAKLEDGGLNRVRRLLRFFYSRYDGIFVLNTEQQGWLSGQEMRLEPSKVFLTAHWAGEVFRPVPDQREKLFGIERGTPVMLFSGRLSEEKGISELPGLFRRVKEEIPGLRFVVAGTGPAEDDLRNALPEALFLGWVNHDELPEIYSSADLLVLPSRFDTFSCAVLESISCGLPVIAYDTKGPKDILQGHAGGFLVENTDEMASSAINYFSDPRLQAEMKGEALRRSHAYETGVILDQFLSDLGLRPAC
jgi:glycosyltransferase involved in cell wall biosynthesis